MVATVWMLGGCYAEAPGVELRVDITASQTGVERAEDHLTVTNDLGVELVITHGWIAVTHAALEPCEAGRQAASWLDLFEGTAAAHDVTLMGDDLDAVVVRLDGRAPVTQLLGVLRPAPTTWCSITLQYGPVGSLDDTAVPDGTWALDAHGTESAAHSLRGSERILATAPLDPPLTLDGQDRSATLSVALPLSAWLDGLQATDDDDTMRATILAHLTTPPTVVIE